MEHASKKIQSKFNFTENYYEHARKKHYDSKIHRKKIIILHFEQKF